MSAEALKNILAMSAKLAADNNQINQERVYLAAGHEFSNEALPEREIETLAKKIVATRYTFKPGECYMNAGRVALETDLTFCEGFAIGLWPVGHGWLCYKGRAIDVTWPTEWKAPGCYHAASTVEIIAERIRFNLTRSFYWGVEVPTPIARRNFMSRMRWSPIFDQQQLNKWRSAGLTLEQMSEKLLDSSPSKNAMIISRRRK